MRVLLILLAGLFIGCGSQSSKRHTNHSATIVKSESDSKKQQATENNSGDKEDDNGNIGDILARGLGGDDDKEKMKYNDAEHFCKYYPPTGNQQVDALQASALSVDQARKVILLLQQAEEAGAASDIDTRNELLGAVQEEVKLALNNYAQRCGEGMQLTGGIIESIFGAVAYFLKSALGIVTTFAVGAIDLTAYTLKSSILAINQTANIALFGVSEEEVQQETVELQQLRKPFPTN
ncbi:MAG: hypothetical protein HRU09_13835 [Oligoflexales bacterium]|nr:hypothetical protein [Oligoflexales bacterium]